jgi:predicted helicase
VRYSKEAPTLLTNFYEFRIIDRGEEVRRFTLGKDGLLSKPIPEVVAEAEHELLDFLRHWAGLHTPIASPGALAERLSEYAREALRRLEAAPQDSLKPLRDSMEKALGISISDSSSGHFFQSSIVQALFYGLFSAWVNAVQRGAGQSFELREASSHLQVPLVVELFEELTQPRRLKNLDLATPVSWAVDALKRVDAEPFLRAFEEGQAVQYFYEPFFEKFDSQLRDDLGVWYTPREIVRYQVEKTHGLLQDELGIEKGLLDERVVVLNPATGTGSYLLEIGRFLLEQLAGDPFAGRLVKEAFQSRIHGFELLPAPFIIAHLQLGLLLSEAGAPLKEDERVGVYLTNSLLNWKVEKNSSVPLHSEWAREKEAADSVKQQQEILVFIGNPPYNRYTGIAEDEQADLIAPYKRCLYESWGVSKTTLDDLYIRFIRLAEQQIVEMKGEEGVVSLVTNRSYLTGLSHPVMRQHLVENFHNIYIDDLHGSQRSNWANNGNVFSTETAGGVRVGIAITHFVKKKEPKESADVFYREYRTGTGKEKRAALVDREQPFGRPFKPERQHRYLLRPLVGEDAYWTWPDLVDMFPVRFSGVNTNRDEAVIATDANSLSKRMKDYFDKSSSNQLMSQRYSALMHSVSYFDASQARTKLLETSAFDPSKIVELNYRPFDSRKLYFEPALINRERPEFFEQVFTENAFLVSSQTMRRGYDRHSFSKTLIDLNIFDPNARAFPLQLRYKPEGLFDNDGLDDYRYLPNVADFYDDLVQNKLLKLAKIKDGCTPMPKPEPVLSRYGAIRDDAGKPTADAFRLSEALFYHALAVMHAPAYREEHAEYLAEDWPRIPLPETRARLEQGEALGKEVGTLLDPLSDASELLTAHSELGRFTGDLSGELKIGSKPAWAAGVLTLNAGLKLENVPKAVWGYTLGGYPVIPKWLGYRKDTVLNTQDARWLSEIVKRIAALIGMGEALNEYYKQNSVHK